MATYRVSTTGSNTSPYDTWAKAATTLAAALTAATTAGDVVLIDSGHQESGTAFTATATARLSVIVVDKDASDALDTQENGGGFFKATSTGAISLTWVAGTYIYGLNVVHAGTGARLVVLSGVSGATVTFENSRFAMENTGQTGNWTTANSVDSPSHTRFERCKFVVANAANVFRNNGRVAMENCSMSIFTAGAAPTSWINFTNGDPGGSEHTSIGCDWSALGSNALMGGANLANGVCKFVQCKLGSGYVMLAAASTPDSLAGGEVWVLDSSSGDTHTEFAYQNKLGAIVCDNTIKYTGGAAGLSWSITTTALAIQSNPFITPWISLHHTGTSAITPRLEIHRDNNATAWTNAEVWGEFSAKVTSGSTQSTISGDGALPLATAANQDAGTDTWDADNATHWAGKVNATLTPAEAGAIRARVLVGVALDGTSGNVLRVDPQIRT